MMRVELDEIRSQLIDRWIVQFNKDFNLVDSDSLLNKIDPTIAFNNCSICIFKNNIIEKSEIEDYIVIQDCLRTNTYRQIHDLDNYKWTANITMLGGYKKVTVSNSLSILANMIERQYKFLEPFISDKINLLIEVSEENYYIYKVLESNRNVKVNIVKSEELRWKYGIRGYTGIGSEWILESDNSRYHFGNTILIYENGKPIGIDFGGSLEVLVQTMLGEDYKIFGCSYAKSFVLTFINKSEEHRLLTDCLATLLLIFDSTDNIKNISISFEQTLYEYLYATISLLIITDLEYSEVKLVLYDLSKNLLFKKEIEEKYSIYLLNKLTEIRTIIEEKDFYYKFLDYNKLTNLEKKAFKKLRY